MNLKENAVVWAGVLDAEKRPNFPPKFGFTRQGVKLATV